MGLEIWNPALVRPNLFGSLPYDGVQISIVFEDFNPLKDLDLEGYPIHLTLVNGAYVDSFTRERLEGRRNIYAGGFFVTPSEFSLSIEGMAPINDQAVSLLLYLAMERVLRFRWSSWCWETYNHDHDRPFVEGPSGTHLGILEFTGDCVIKM